MFVMRMLCWVMIGFLGACASVEYAIPDVTSSEAAEQSSIRSAYDAAAARRARVYDLAWPILTASTELCPEVSQSIGIVLADRKSHALLSSGLREEDMERLGVPDAVHVYHVSAGSPAAAAGFQPNDILTDVDGKEIDSPGAAAKAIREATKEGGEVTVGLERGDEALELSVAGVDRCSMAVKIANSPAINASAAGGDIAIYQGLINALDDEALQFVIAHEAAHLAARHPQKYTRNIVVSGAVVAGPVLYTGAWVGDRALRLFGIRHDQSLRSKTLRAMAPWASSFEAEADYLGAYFFVRAGGDLASAREAFETFARESPRSIFVRATHPLVPDRIVALDLVTQEIEAKQASGAPLRPNKRAE